VLSVELHAHSVHSYDGVDPVSDLLEQAERADLDALAVTDHDRIEGGLEAAERAPEYGVVAIPGIEITSAAGHVLGLGVEERISSGLEFAETVDRIHDAGGIAVVPHPFQELRGGVLANVEQDDLLAADAIEIYNSRLVTGRSNRQAMRLAAELGMPATAASDAHVSEMVGRAVTRVDADRHPAAILDAIRDGRTDIEGRRTPFRVTAQQAAQAARQQARDRLAQFR
jgi:predicted metal-dependent phosphoesterase TrpH